MNSKTIVTAMVAMIVAIGMTGIGAAYSTATVSYGGSNGEFTIETYTPNVYDVQTCSFDGTVSGWQTVTEKGPLYHGDNVKMERITTTTGVSSIATLSYITSPCNWDEDGVIEASVTTDTGAALSQLGSAQGLQNSHLQPSGLNFGPTTSYGVTDLYADGEYTMALSVARFIPNGATEAEASVTLVGSTDDTAYLGSARMQVGDGFACHGTGFRNYYPGSNNQLNGFVVSAIGSGVAEVRAFEGAAVWGNPYLNVDTTITADGISTHTDVATVIGHVYQVYTFEDGISGYGDQLAH